MNEQMKETASLKVRLPGKAREYCFRLKKEAEEAQRQWLEAKKLGESGKELIEKRDKMRKYLTKKKEFIEFLEMDAEKRRQKAEGLVVSKEIMEVLSEVFEGETLDEMTLPTPEELTDEYFDRMYPKTQREEDTKKELVSYRPDWWDKTADASVVGPAKETWGQAYIRSIKAEAVKLQGTILLTESIQKPKYTGSSQKYGTKEGEDDTKDPLLPIIQEVFGERANRFNLS